MLFRMFPIVLWFPAFLIAFQNEDLEKEIEKAKEVYAQNVEKARTVLLEKLDMQIKKHAKTGNLELVQKLVADKKEFEMNDSRIPVSPEFKTDVSEYQQRFKKEKDVLLGVFGKGIKEYTKKLDLDKAAALKLEVEAISSGSKFGDFKSEKAALKKDNKDVKGFHSLMVFGSKDQYIHHGDFFGRVGRFNEVNGDVAPKNATFEVVKGLSRFSKSDHVSFRSENYPDYYISLEGFQIKIKRIQNNDGFLNSSTFKKTKGLANEEGVSFELLNSQRFYIRNKNGLLFIDKYDGSKKFRDDSTFQFTDPLFVP